MIDIDKFLFLYQGIHGTLNDHQRQGLTDLLGFIIQDAEIINIHWMAYMLATTQHECAGTWQPIAEYGKGNDRPYGAPDPATGHVYYGRGFVQLTHAENYKQMAKVTGLDLYNNPDQAMVPHVAYQIMSYGMRTGAFTGVGLLRYINDKQCDYRLARKIINGLDCAEKIESYAKEFQSILEVCTA